MSTESILKHILDENLVDAQKEINSLLTIKIGDALQQFKEDYIPFVYSESLGVAGIAEAKKKAAVTDKEDDGEGMDPVGKADSDIDNDGDSDDSDEYLKNRRKKIGKNIDKDDDEEEVDEDVKAASIYGVERTKYASMTDDQKDQVKAKYYREAETAQRERR
tara:strand:+ start:2038 stop:2523 length:486 start_codon:yes stop_codon:yes gene_type:complete